MILYSTLNDAWGPKYKEISKNNIIANIKNENNYTVDKVEEDKKINYENMSKPYDMNCNLTNHIKECKNCREQFLKILNNYDTNYIKKTPVIEIPVIKIPVIEKPVIEIPVIEKPVIEKPVIEKPVIETLVNSTSIETPEKSTSIETPVKSTSIETPVKSTSIETPQINIFGFKFKVSTVLKIILIIIILIILYLLISIFNIKHNINPYMKDNLYMLPNNFMSNKVYKLVHY